MKNYKKEDLEKLSKVDLVNIGTELEIEDSDFLTKARLINEILQHNEKDLKQEIIEVSTTETIEKTIEKISETNFVYNNIILEDIYKNLIFDENDEIEVPKKLEVYKNIEITEMDSYRIQTDIDLADVVLLSNENGYCGHIQIVENEKNKFLVGNSKNINYDKLHENIFFDFIFFNKKDSKSLQNSDPTEKISCYKVECDIEIKELQKINRWLCMDFGTSNTSIGTYDDNREAKIVQFMDVTNNKLSEVIPTIVWVEDCSDSENVKYLFGYEAKKKIEESDFKFRNSVFYEIKKWIQEDVEIVESINDSKGKKAIIKRKDIIKEYLLFVIKHAESYLKNKFEYIHMTAPVKLKQKYIKIYKEALIDSNYKVRSSELALDEGIAIVYNYIKDVMKWTTVQGINTYPSEHNGNKNEKVVIIDVGGGTTDLASCSFEFQKKSTGNELIIETNFEDGDSNFGGNNITYRILQYIKIKLANYYDKELNNGESAIICNIEHLFPNNSKILEKIDSEKGVGNLYEKLEESYSEAGKIIPTDFSINDKFNSRQAEAVLKRNFYLLWEVAENVKKEFFRRTDLLMIDFKSNDESNKKIRVPRLEKLDISIVQDLKLKERTDLPDLSISIKEIEDLIYGEIYNILRKLLSDTSENNILKDYDLFRLSGQTCKISLFAELLKEFIPGKKLRGSEIKNNEEKDTLELKLQCLKGGIHYMSDNESGIVGNQKIINKKPSLNYKIMLDREQKQEILSKSGITISEYDPSKAGEAKFDIHSQDGELIKSEKYEFAFGSEKKIDLEEILMLVSEEFEYNLREQLERTGQNIRIIIAIPTEDRFGFEVLDLTKLENNEFYLRSENNKIFSFEKSLEAISFFNGRR
ncbi:MAG: hypothetical protein ACRC0F_10540 [Cetobacterium sp.]